MGNILIITVAGTSTRFNNNERVPSLKPIYFEEDYKKTLLFNLVNISNNYFDKIIMT